MDISTVVCVVETNPHRQTSHVWTSCGTVGEVINTVYELSSFSNTRPSCFLENEDNASIDELFDASIQCSKSDGHRIDVFWSKADAIDHGAPIYMSDSEYLEKIDIIFGD